METVLLPAPLESGKGEVETIESVTAGAAADAPVEDEDGSVANVTKILRSRPTRYILFYLVY